jgi:hypothetical protein
MPKMTAGDGAAAAFAHCSCHRALDAPEGGLQLRALLLAFDRHLLIHFESCRECN